MRSTPEWVAAHDDQKIPPHVCMRVYDKHEGKCCECKRKVGNGLAYNIDHTVALCNGGQHRESNLQLLCVECHAVKTKSDVAEKSKVARIRTKHLGLSKPKRSFPKRIDPWGRDYLARKATER